MKTWNYFKLFGILTYMLLFAAALSGRFRWKLKVHVLLAGTALVLATAHALMIILLG